MGQTTELPTRPWLTSYLPQADVIVMQNLYQDMTINPKDSAKPSEYDKATIQKLRNLNDPSHPTYERSILSMWDEKDVPQWIDAYILRPYYEVARNIVRYPTDVVFLTHIIWNLGINVPSAIYLFNNFTWLHGIVHAVHAIWCAGPMTLLLHNHIHNNGVLARSWKWLDFTFPYVVEPLIGHTWDTYYYHHVRHHHVEANGKWQSHHMKFRTFKNKADLFQQGPDDLSSTIRYQRDDPLHFLHYLGRFLFLIWLELPLYFIRRKQPMLAFRAGASELTSYVFLYHMTFHVNAQASFCVFLLPLMFMRIALMMGNWGQHALVDEIEPDHDLRSSITLIDMTSNRLCFNDGYHTSHHLNPRRHWRDQPSHFMQQKETFAEGKALVFHDIDFFMMTIKLLCKDYAYLARHLVPIGDQVGMTQTEIEDMLRTKTRQFSEEDIKLKFRQKGRLK